MILVLTYSKTWWIHSLKRQHKTRWALEDGFLRAQFSPDVLSGIRVDEVIQIKLVRSLKQCRREIYFWEDLFRARILYQDLFTDPSLHNQARRRISWRRWLRHVNGSHLEKTQWRRTGASSGACRSDDTYGSSSIFRDPKKNAGISKGPFHGYYQERPATRSLKTQSWASSTTARTSRINLTREDSRRRKREQVWC